MDQTSKETFTWTIHIELKENEDNKIKNIDSPTHKIISTFDNEKKITRVNFEKEEIPNKDFVLHY